MAHSNGFCRLRAVVLVGVDERGVIVANPCEVVSAGAVGQRMHAGSAQARDRHPRRVAVPSCALTGLAGIYSDPGHVMMYADGELRQQFAVCFHAKPLLGEPRPDHLETINAPSARILPRNDRGWPKRSSHRRSARNHRRSAVAVPRGVGEPVKNPLGEQRGMAMRLGRLAAQIDVVERGRHLGFLSCVGESGGE